MQTKEHSYIGPRDVRPISANAVDVKDYNALALLGVNFGVQELRAMARYAMDSYGMDDQQGLLTTASIPTLVQFLQNWLPGFVEIITAPRNIDELIGISTIGSWEDEEIVQGIKEPIGSAVPYGDMTNVPLANWNTNFEKRTVIRFELGLKVGMLEEARAARIRVSSASEKRNSTSLALEVERNKVGFYGYNSGNNQTYGFLNDPNLPAYVTVATGVGGYLWSQKTFQEITADIRTAAAALQAQTQGSINPRKVPTTLAIPVNRVQYLSVTTDFGQSVEDWIKKTYPQMRIEDAPQLDTANGGANVFYLYAESVADGGSDDGRVWAQIVPAKFQALGVEKQSKAYVEDYTNATAGALLKRPYAVVRYSGI